jgi:hypothetical protein
MSCAYLPEIEENQSGIRTHLTLSTVCETLNLLELVFWESTLHAAEGCFHFNICLAKTKQKSTLVVRKGFCFAWPSQPKLTIRPIYGTVNQ